MEKNHFKSSLGVAPLFLLASSLFISSSIMANEKGHEVEEKQDLSIPNADETLEKMEVLGVRERLQRKGTLLDVIQKTEVITDADIEKKNAATLTEAIKGETGIRVSNECSMCGVKRVMMNGLKGEHTTVLVDGIPLYSGVAGFYGLDAISASGLGRIEIARGAGASLIAPEAIGGTINMITKRATKNSVSGSLEFGEHQAQKLSGLATAVSKDGATRLVTSGQFDTRDQFDGDNNGVSENPRLENTSVFAKLSQDIGDSDSVDVRSAYYRSKVFGGPMSERAISVTNGFVPGSESLPLELFEGGDVRNTFTGKPWETAEIVNTDRTELSVQWTHEINDSLNSVFTGAYAEHIQDSFYEGFDYYADDDLFYFDSKFNYSAVDKHVFTVGLDYRDEKMRSRSDLVDSDPELVSDSYDHSDLGFYLQDVWTPTDNIEASLALRVDRIEVDFIDQPAENKIEKTLVAPRAHVRWTHDDEWSSRFSVGRGYRAPLSIFETEHGLLEDGFNIDITDIEESLSTGYSLSYDSPQLTAVGSINHTKVENAATTDDSASKLTLINSDKEIGVTNLDFQIGYEMSPQWSIGSSLEFYDYDDNYKSTFAIAPIETRARFALDYNKGPLSFNTSLTWVGSRDLSEYGYGDRFNVFNDSNNNGTVEAGELQAAKSTDADAYFTLDARAEYAINKNISAYVGGTNLFDTTQAGDSESPLLWDADGGYDVVHMNAPLRGRTIYGGIKVNF